MIICNAVSLEETHPRWSTRTCLSTAGQVLYSLPHPGQVHLNSMRFVDYNISIIHRLQQKDKLYVKCTTKKDRSKLWSQYTMQTKDLKKISHANVSEYSNHLYTSTLTYEIYFYESFITCFFQPFWSDNPPKFTFAEPLNPTSEK